MLRVVVLVSGGGTNLQAIMDAVENGTITNTEIVGVISNNQGAYALERAKTKGKTGLKVRYVSDRTDSRFFFFHFIGSCRRRPRRRKAVYKSQKLCYTRR